MVTWQAAQRQQTEAALAAKASDSPAAQSLLDLALGQTKAPPFPVSPDLESIKEQIVDSVDHVIRTLFPELYCGLCHTYAIVGSNVASLVLGRAYRPVAGLAVIDCGNGGMMKLLENKAFSTSGGGSYHCWIESCPSQDANKELIDIIFKHNETYANTHGLNWQQKDSSYLWGAYRDLVLDSELEALPTAFLDRKIWLKETSEGSSWIKRHIAEHENAYVELTSMVLRRQQDKGKSFA